MTVDELIEALMAFPPDMEVKIYDGEQGDVPIGGMEVRALRDYRGVLVPTWVAIW